MADLNDTGARTTYPGGAMREVLEEKGRCDLLPLFVIANRTHDSVFNCIENYIRYGGIDNLWVAIDCYIVREDTTFWQTLLEVSIHYADGIKKYGDRNWEKGLPLTSFIDSGIRHYIKYRDKMTDEPHGRAFIWNMLGAIWTHENHPDLIDLPFAKTKTAEEIAVQRLKKVENTLDYDPDFLQWCDRWGVKRPQTYTIGGKEVVADGCSRVSQLQTQEKV